MALDMVNAFGEISRVDFLEEVLSTVPELAPFLIQLWGDNGTPIFVANSTSTWKTFCLVHGLFQGHNLSSLLFCLGLRRAMRRFEGSCENQLEPDDDSVHMEYIDDLFLDKHQFF